jgi:hypothetical protein
MSAKIIRTLVALSLLAAASLRATSAAYAMPAQQQQQWSNVLDERAATSRRGFDAPIAQ